MASNWTETTLENVADLTVGFVGTMKNEYVDKGVPFLRSLNVEPFFVNRNDLKFITPSFAKTIKKSELHSGDVVIVRTGKPGTCAVVPDEFDMANCSDLVVVRPNRELIDPLFLAAYLNSMVYDQVFANIVGAVQQHFNVNSAKKIVLRIPNLEIQRYISELIRNLNRKIQLNNESQFIYSQINGAVFRRFFGTTNLHDPIESNVFANICEIKEKNKYEKDYPVLSVVKEGEFKASEDVFTKQVYSKSTKNYKIVRRNQIAYNPARANIGSIAMLKEFDIGLVSPVYTVFEVKEDITPTYFYYYMKQPMFLEMIKHHAIGTTRQNFPFEAFKMFPIVVPPMDLQLKFEEIAKPIEQKITKLKEENEVLAEIRDTLLPKLMSGEFPVEVGEENA